MGTRADFWIDDGKRMEWLGSVAFDGYEWQEQPGCDVMRADDEHTFRRAVVGALATRRAIMPAEGWPWPWPDSNTTDYAYVLRNDLVEVYTFGRLVLGVDADGSLHREEAEDTRWPTMTTGQPQADTASNPPRSLPG